MEKNWWQQAVFYQIYPRSFKDSNGDGIGDLGGILQKLDYLEKLGVSALWLSPIYPSPNVDNGYDISDYQDIDPQYGTMAEFETLIQEGRKRNVKIILDLVLNHTSNQHPWFKEALKGPKSPYYDYYVWENGAKEELPNDLKSNFGGSAWEYVPHLGAYYCHLHAKEQPDLNWQNPKLREELYQMMNFWLEKGIGGFRLDVIDLIGKIPLEKITKNGPDLHPFLQEMNQKTFGKYDVATVGEAWGATPELAKLYTKKDRHELSMIFQFEHLNVDKVLGKRKWDLKTFEPKELHAIFSKWQVALNQEGWNSLFWNNHDLPRVISRFGDEDYREESGKMLAAYLHMMKGTPYIYQGEEIGLINYPVTSIDEVDDIESKNMYHERLAAGYEKSEILKSINAKGRDNARHPIPWDERENTGFSTSSSWLATYSEKTPTVKNQLEKPDSLFYWYQKLIRLRKELPILVDGSYEDVPTENKYILSYLRKTASEELRVVANFSNQEQNFTDYFFKEKNLLLHNYSDVDSEKLRPYEVIVCYDQKS